MLLGFGLESYICLGTNSEGQHSWVMTKGAAEGSTKKKVYFWESLTGQKMEVDDPRVHRFYRAVGSVFNNKYYFANI